MECAVNHRCSFMALLNVQKAFDTVWHNGSLYKLFQCGIRGDVWFVIKDWYSKLSSAVIWGNCTSSYFSVGAMQGSILSPLLYAVFMSDLLYELEESGRGVCIDSIFLHMLIIRL